MIENPTPTALFIGRQLRRRRKMIGLTLKQVGARVGMKYQQVQKYEVGECRVYAEQLYVIAKALEVEISYFFPQQEQRKAA